MAKARIGHFVEAQILQALEVDYIDESEVLTPADEANHIDKWDFKVPFVCGATNLGEALRRISEGAAMIRTKGEAGTGNVVEAVRHMRSILGEIRSCRRWTRTSCMSRPRTCRRPYELVRFAENGELPVVTSPPAAGHPGRRRHDDAAGRRRRVRRLRHLQERRPAAARGRDREGHDPLQRRRRSWPRCRAAWASPWSASRCRRWARRAAADAWLGSGRSPRPAGGVPRALPGAGRRRPGARSRCASRAIWRGWTGWSSPAASRPRCRS